MTMTLNEALSKYNFISKVILKNGNDELSRNLKVKIMSMRIEYGKIQKQFEADLQEFIKGLQTEEFEQLKQVPENERTEEQTTRLSELVDQINGDYNLYVQKKGLEEVNPKDFSISEDEFAELMLVNIDNNVTINGTSIEAADFLEILNTLFVK